MQAADLARGRQGKGMAQVALAGGGVQLLLRRGVDDPLQPVLLQWQVQLLAQPLGEQRRLVETALALAALGQRHGQQQVGPGQAFVEGMQQVV
ncbi:hypothetical protein D9M68_959990 [compost metagenome]